MSQVTMLVEPILYPIGILWVVLLLSAIRSLAKGKWTGALVPGGLALFVFVVGATSLPARLLATLERPYAAQDLDGIPAADAVVMLGGTLRPSRSDPFGFDLGLNADRALTAAEVIRRGKTNILIVGGGGASKGDAREAKLIERWLGTWNLQPKEFIALKGSRNTYAEAMQVATLAQQRGWGLVLLVTSARHMRRAAATFRTAGVPVLPVACDYYGMSSLERSSRPSLVPREEGFRHLEFYLHEIVGWHLYKWQGWIRS